MKAYEVVKSVLRKVTGVADDKRYQRRVHHEHNHLELPGQVGECYWCHGQRPLRFRLLGLNLCVECAPPIRRVENKFTTPWGGEDVFVSHRVSTEDYQLWVGRRKQMLIQGWTGHGVPPRLEE